jgi:hypothetical protein
LAATKSSYNLAPGCKLALWPVGSIDTERMVAATVTRIDTCYCLVIVVVVIVVLAASKAVLGITVAEVAAVSRDLVELKLVYSGITIAVVSSWQAVRMRV